MRNRAQGAGRAASGHARLFVEAAFRGRPFGRRVRAAQSARQADLDESRLRGLRSGLRVHDGEGRKQRRLHLPLEPRPVPEIQDRSAAPRRRKPEVQGQRARLSAVRLALWTRCRARDSVETRRRVEQDDGILPRQERACRPERQGCRGRKPGRLEGSAGQSRRNARAAMAPRIPRALDDPDARSRRLPGRSRRCGRADQESSHRLARRTSASRAFTAMRACRSGIFASPRSAEPWHVLR